MTIIAVISPKGGVGKTTVTANLACALGAKGYSCRLVDLDPQNALRLHLGANLSDSRGLIHQTLQRTNWEGAEYNSAYGISFIPYGKASEFERIAFESQLAHEPNWLRDNLAKLGNSPGGLTILDTPPGPSLYAQQALSIAQLVLVVMLPDAGSFATLSSIESLLDHYCAYRSDFHGAYYILNQFDAALPLNRDIRSALKNLLGDRLAPHCIHRDGSMSEALAFQQPARQYAPYSQATADIEQVAAWLQARMAQLPNQYYPVRE